MSGDDTEFAALLSDVMKNPEETMTREFTDEQLIRLQKELNPYTRIAGPKFNAKNARAIACSFTNLREDYIRRFTMTSLVAFLFRMLSEHEIPAEQRRWTPKKTTKRRRGADATPFSGAELAKHAAALVELADLVVEAEKNLADCEAEAARFSKEELTFTEKEMTSTEPNAGREAKMQEYQTRVLAVTVAKDRLWGLKYTATLQGRNFGMECDTRILPTEAEALKFPDSKQVIEDSPNRYNGLLPRGEIEMPVEHAQGIIRGFLHEFFEFDPDKHVRKAYDEVVIQTERKDVAGLGKVTVDVHDPERLPLHALFNEGSLTSSVAEDKDPLMYTVGEQRRYNTVCRLLDDPVLAGHVGYIFGGGAADPDRRERFRRMLLPKKASEMVPAIPPQDTFHRWNYYAEVNYEALRSAVDCIFHDKPDMDFALGVWDVFEGTAEEIREQGSKFRDDNLDSLISEISTVYFGGWTFLGDFAKNREHIDICNSKVELLKRILDRHEQDKKLGEDLMRKRVYKAKAKNIREAGPDAPGLGAYKGANPVRGVSGTIAPEQMRRLERAQGDVKAARELEFYEAQEKIAHDLQEQSKLRALTQEESRALRVALEEMEKAKEMLAVPDDAIQVDVWTHDTKTGSFGKSKFYTEAERPNMSQAVPENASPKKKSLRGHTRVEVDDDDEDAPVPGLPSDLRKINNNQTLAPFAQNFLDVERKAQREAEEAEMNMRKIKAGVAAPVKTDEELNADIDEALGLNPSNEDK